MEELTLPEPGRELFGRTRKLLVQGAGLADQTESPRTVFAGGTILAARWNHRNSKDNDIRSLHDGSNGVLTRLRRVPAMLSRWNQWLSEAGMTPLDWASAYKATSQIRGREGKNDPTLEIGEFAAPLERSARRSRVEGTEVWVASTESILAGKWWGRRDDPPLRDVFDWAVAGAMDPKGVQIALQTVKTPNAIDTFVDTMAQRRESYMAESKSREGELKSTEQWETERRNPAFWAAATISRWAMKDLTVERSEGGWTVRTQCEAKPEGIIWTRESTVLERAVAIARYIGQLTDEKATEVYQQCQRDGGSTTGGAGKARQRSVTRSIEVDSAGRVTISEFGAVVATEPTIGQAVERGLENGMWGQEQTRDIQQKMEQVRMEENIRPRG